MKNLLLLLLCILNLGVISAQDCNDDDIEAVLDFGEEDPPGTCVLTLTVSWTDLGGDADVICFSLDNCTSATCTGSADPGDGEFELDFTALCASSLCVAYFIKDSEGDTCLSGNFFFANPLPVEMVEFDGRLDQDNNVYLTWLTASEVDNDYFEVLTRNANGKWYTIPGSKIPGQGTTSSFTAYEYLHTDPLKGPNYYQIKQVDYSGDFELSPIEVVHVGDPDEKIVVYPNPAKNIIFIQGKGVSTYYHIKDYPTGVNYLQIKLPNNKLQTVRFTKVE